jgi:hypothetical protein
MPDFLTPLLTIAGLVLFEVITSIDNAVINAEVLSTMSQRARRWFLTWGILFAVFMVRGLLPWMIVWATTPSLGPLGAWTSAFSNDPAVAQAIEESAPPLLALGGLFLVFLFLHWLLLEPKAHAFQSEQALERHGVWFFALVSVILAALTWFALRRDPIMAFGLVMGSTVFFITHGFRENAAAREQQLLADREGSLGLSDWSKIMYLEVLDASFSIDGVLGAFAFTLSVPVILFGNGIGAIAVRQITVSNIERVKRYRYLKNGAMYSICILGSVMLVDAFGMHVPEWVSPIATFAIIGFFFWKSWRELQRPVVRKAEG